jgi:hypothetical protein
MKKQLAIILSLVIIAVFIVSAFAALEIYKPSPTVASKKPFYVGVTYCGNSITEAEQLIDRVKNYTNLFVVQSGPLMDNGTALDQICDYAVNSGLTIIMYMTNGVPTINVPSFIDSAQARWGSHFLGLYYSDEPGGRMLDSGIQFYDASTGQSINKGPGWVTVNINAATNNSTNSTGAFHGFNFFQSGKIVESISYLNAPDGSTTYTSDGSTTTYYPNGTIENAFSKTINGTYTFGDLFYQPNGTVEDQNGTLVTDEGNISQFEPYAQVWNMNPIKDYNDAANIFVSTEQHTLSSIGNRSDVELFTSDYGLYWFDYKGGYNTVFAELFGGQTDAQTLALVRGAADMQDKTWGVMIEPASQSPLSLQNGTQMFNELRQAYENGAQYAVVFNYSPSGNGTGLLQDEQFGAIQKFWTDVVQNPKDTNNVEAQDALVLPADYGWGMRNPNDSIWGFWQPDNSSQQVWNAVQASLAKYGSNIDIIYDNTAYPTAGQYPHVYYWNQTI